MELMRRRCREWRRLSLPETGAVVLLSAWISAYALMMNRRQGTLFAVLCAAAAFPVSCALSFCFLSESSPKKINRKILTGAAVLLSLAWILLGLNNSSIGAWREILFGELPAALLGYGRTIRSDEWAVWTPMLFSQAAQGYPAVNTAITASSVDPAFIAIGGLPAWNLAAVFKPFYWGFLLFGTETGFSVLTLARFAGLFAVSRQCALRYTRNSKPLSAAAAFLITLSPYVQWWFSQSICEVLFFSQAMILSWIRAMEAKTAGGRAGFGALFSWCFGCFVMVAYPAWQIPVMYLAAILLVRAVLRRRETFRLSGFFQVLAPLAISVFLLVLIFRNSWDTLTDIRNSAYPGQRVYTGGDMPRNLFTGLLSLLLPVGNSLGSGINPCELSNFLSFAPAGLILTINGFVKTKEKDGLSMILLAVAAVFGLFAVIRLPDWLISISFLSQCVRPAFIVQLCNLLLLLRALAIRDEKPFSRKAGFLAVAACTACSAGLSWFFVRPAAFVMVALIPATFGLFWLLLSGRGRKFTAAVLCLAAVIAGGFVNPIQKGLSEVQSLPTVALVNSAGLDPEETVIAVEGQWPVTDSALFSGMKVFNSTQPYADPDRWNPADPGKEWVNVYNRLAHVSLEVSEETGFELIGGDHFLACLTLDDLKRLGVNTLLTEKEYADLPVLASGGSWRIYDLGNP